MLSVISGGGLACGAPRRCGRRADDCVAWAAVALCGDDEDADADDDEDVAADRGGAEVPGVADGRAAPGAGGDSDVDNGIDAGAVLAVGRAGAGVRALRRRVLVESKPVAPAPDAGGLPKVCACPG
jgi:hypothetical protein